MILYRQQSSIKGAAQLPSVVAKVLQMALEASGYDTWMDKKDLSVTSQGLKDSINRQMLEMKIAILCMGVGDLERCSNDDDFFRWEINRARELEEEGVLGVVIIVHGTVEVEDLICGVSSGAKRKSALASVGNWGEAFLEYLSSHYVIFFDIDALDNIVEKIIAKFKEEV